ncbi:ATP-binding protein [Rhodoplanes sp. Z2-YC6860]|uniref:ATP-binding protein n=1 Tax=Rhodoplanes sp. Z2-YC6860 TaxID=674703 RepID=UPI00078DB444|nr:ATP-binding protein [Rhodoplanes sp. Z2-YC6860]AMN43040.1 periplasmic sensor hybrid histidine kinase [Rhodoplanes sp. Z2-YC6860]
MQARQRTIRLIWLAVGTSIVLPCLIFGYSAWISYRDLQALAHERLVRSLDTQQEEAQKTFELIDLTIQNALRLLAGMSADDIRANEQKLHLELEKLSDSVEAVQSIAAYGTDGVTLTSSLLYPAPRLSYADRDFMQAHLKDNVGTFYGQVYVPTTLAEPFFTVSRRIENDGKFVGVLEISVLPSNIFRFFSTLIYTRGLQYALVREDGLFLVRYPAVPADAPIWLGENTGFRRTVRASTAGGFYSSISPVDNVQRNYAIRRVGTRPLYLTAGIESAAVQQQWLSGRGAQLAYGLPATLFLVLTLWTVLRRTESLYAEIDRRGLAEEALRRSQKLEAIGHLTGGVAHDFNNLLTIILGNLDGLRRQLNDADPKIVRRVDNALHGANRAATLTKRLLAFSRQQPLRPVPIDLNQLMNGLSDFLQRALGEQISLEVVGSGGLWPVEVDSAELEAVLINLAVNARDAMPAGGKLTIEAGNAVLDEAYRQRNEDVQPGEYVRIAVTDTGSGMTSEVLERAFEPFFTTKQAGQGTGLGLSQVYGFVKQSGGHVKIYSEPGDGTTVKLYLPRYHGAVVVQDQTPAEPVRGKASELILVVEDDAEVRSYIVETLAGLGYRVLDAKSGEDALGVLEQHRDLRLLLTDVVMPGMNGRMLADEAQKRLPGLKILYMTGYSRNAIVHHGRLDSGVHLIEKPVAVDQLAGKVRSLLDS